MSKWVASENWSQSWKHKKSLRGGGQGTARIVSASDGLPKQYFLKELHGRLRSNAKARKRFLREASAYQIFIHPRIPQLIESNADAAVANDAITPYFVTELVAGSNLEDWISKHGSIEFHDALTLTERMLHVLEYLHSEQCFHRDIKPRNIIVKDDIVTEPVLVDFGISVHTDGHDTGLTQIGEEIGNRFLRLPELASQSSLKQDGRSDLAFVGGILFYVLTGIEPAQLLNEQNRLPHQREQARESLLQKAGPHAAKLIAFLDKAFAYNIDARFANAAQMRDQLSNLLTPSSAGDDMSIEQLEAEIEATLTSAENQRINAVLRARRDVQSRVRAIANDVINKNGRGLFNSLTRGGRSSNTESSASLGFVHTGDTNKQFLPKLVTTTNGPELVVTLNEREVLRSDVDKILLDDVFDTEVRKIYLRGLKALTSNS